ncbi:DUF6982 domain-containing protein [Vulgatibacter incomptus]|uniref:Extensin-like protein n=1 Tax=Vulgatibacter incomptus TaxID=1391653 RepID=A0A0K1PDJ7_9BACT|nr:hypothetical protein [Vulgatibacter incomptus]AKU91481.1 Extensin-like protein precursor [Vulgatibacter incomptus]
MEDLLPADPSSQAALLLQAGYVLDPASGNYWHPYAQHWLEVASGQYLDAAGARLDPAVARAAVHALTGCAGPAAPAEWAPDAYPSTDSVPDDAEGIFGRAAADEAEPIDDEDLIDDDEVELIDPTAGVEPGQLSAQFTDSWRVVIHMASGAVRRGKLDGADLHAASIRLATPAGPETLATDAIKVIFFMGTEAPAPAIGARQVRLILSDGRPLAGYAPDPLPTQGGFFLLPADSRANTARIFVYPHAIRDVELT